MDDFNFYFFMERIAVAPDNSVVVELGFDFDYSAGRVRTFDVADGGWLWDVSLPDGTARSKPAFDSVRGRMYFNAHNASTDTSFLYAIDLAPRAPGDINGDGSIDLGDAATFYGCMTGPGGSVMQDCQTSDFNGDGDADLADFFAFQAAFVVVE